MMKYESVNHNFIPKEQKIKETSNVRSLEEENRLLTEEKDRLLLTIENLQQQVNGFEEALIQKEEQLVFTKDTISSLEENIGKYEVLKDDLTKVDNLKVEMNQLNSQITRLNKENHALNEEIESYRQHVQTLYLILLILAIL